MYRQRWEQARAAAIRPGDVTPAGLVHHVHRFPAIRMVEIGVGSELYVRNYYAPVTREVR